MARRWKKSAERLVTLLSRLGHQARWVGTVHRSRRESAGDRAWLSVRHKQSCDSVKFRGCNEVRLFNYSRCTILCTVRECEDAPQP